MKILMSAGFTGEAHTHTVQTGIVRAVNGAELFLMIAVFMGEIYLRSLAIRNALSTLLSKSQVNEWHVCTPTGLHTFFHTKIYSHIHTKLWLIKVDLAARI